MKLSVHHATTYRYAEPVARSTQYIRMTPVTNNRQRVLEWQLDLPSRSIQFVDAFGNLTNLMTLARSHDSISIVATGTVEVPDVDDGEPADLVNPRVFLRATDLTELDDAIIAFCEPMRKGVGLAAADRRHRPDVGGPAGTAPEAGNDRCRKPRPRRPSRARAARSRIRCTCSSPAAAASVCRHAT